MKPVDLLHSSSAPSRIGSIALDEPAPYHGTATFHWTLLRRPQYPTLGLFCFQNGRYVYIAELPIARDLTGRASILLANEASSAMPGTIDYAQPSSCSAFIWDERRGGQSGPVAITDSVSFAVAALP